MTVYPGYGAICAAIVAFSICCTTQVRADDCTGTPAGAVMTLPEPLSKWGTIVCTPYGHIISNRQGWIWSNPGGYSPVFIPAQMVQKDPAPVGNASYFTKIEMAKVQGPEFQVAYQAYHQNFAPDTKMPNGYRLDVSSVSGRTLQLFFFDYGTHAWAIWCPDGKCDPSSRFMILDMAHNPQ